MGLTQKLGTIPLAIQTDSSNNVGIGGTPSGSFKFEAIGLTRLASSGATILTINSTNANGSANVYQQSGTNIGWIGNGSSSLIGGSTNDFTINGQTNINLAIGGFSRVIVNSSGNVGIGTSSPQRTFDARGTVNLSTTAPTVGSTSGAYADVHLRTFSGYPTAQAKIVVVDFFTDFYSTYTDGFRWFNWDSAGTTPVERMRITSGGSVCINSTSPLNANAKLNINGELWMGNVTAGAGNSTLKYNSGTGLVTFDASARIFKKDITDLQYGLDSVLKMQPKKYKWKSNDYEDLGFIADEMYEVVPEIVALADNKVNNNGLKDGEPLSINYDRLVPVLVKAIQELNQKVTALENK